MQHVRADARNSYSAKRLTSNTHMGLKCACRVKGECIIQN